MAARWHINNNGEPAICRAASDSACPLKTYDDHGNLVKQQHYSTLSEATHAAEEASKRKYRKIEDKADRPLNSLSRKHESQKTAHVAAGSVPLPPRLTRTSLTASEVDSSVRAGRQMAKAASTAFDHMSVPLPPRPTVDGVSSVPMPRSTAADGISDVPLPPRPTADGSPSVPMPRTTARHATATGVKTAPAGFLPGLTSREKNVALEGLAAVRPDLSYEAVMGKPYSAAGYGDYVAAVEDRLKTDPDARAALSWSVTQARPPFPPAGGAKHAAAAGATREEMWKTLS